MKSHSCHLVTLSPCLLVLTRFAFLFQPIEEEEGEKGQEDDEQPVINVEQVWQISDAQIGNAGDGGID